VLYRSKKIKVGSSQLLSLSMASVCLFLVSCGGNDSSIAVDADADADALLSLVRAAGMTGDPSAGRTLPLIDDPKVQLGKKLFFTKGLGGNDDSACVTCHHP